MPETTQQETAHAAPQGPLRVETPFGQTDFSVAVGSL